MSTVLKKYSEMNIFVLLQKLFTLIEKSNLSSFIYLTKDDDRYSFLFLRKIVKLELGKKFKLDN